jgi:hypothetical protein
MKTYKITIEVDYSDKIKKTKSEQLFVEGAIEDTIKDMTEDLMGQGELDFYYKGTEFECVGNRVKIERL